MYQIHFLPSWINAKMPWIILKMNFLSDETHKYAILFFESSAKRKEHNNRCEKWKMSNKKMNRKIKLKSVCNYSKFVFVTRLILHRWKIEIQVPRKLMRRHFNAFHTFAQCWRVEVVVNIKFHNDLNKMTFIGWK